MANFCQVDTVSELCSNTDLPIINCCSFNRNLHLLNNSSVLAIPWFYRFFVQELPEADVHSCRYVDASFASYEPAFNHVVLGCLSHGHTFEQVSQVFTLQLQKQPGL